MGNAKTKEIAWYVKPNPVLLRKTEFQPYFVGGEKELTDAVIQQRAYDMIINEPSNVKHRLMYAIMAIRLKGDEKAVKQALPELIKYVEDAKACDPKESKCFSLLGFLHEKTGNVEKAREIYLQGYNNVFAVGGRMLSINDIELIALFGAFSEMHGSSLPLPAGDVWKDCCLRAPDSPIANGNYGLFLIRSNKSADGAARLLKAKQLEDDEDGFWAAQYEMHVTNGGKKKK